MNKIRNFGKLGKMKAFPKDMDLGLSNVVLFLEKKSSSS